MVSTTLELLLSMGILLLPFMLSLEIRISLMGTSLIATSSSKQGRPGALSRESHSFLMVVTLLLTYPPKACGLRQCPLVDYGSSMVLVNLPSGPLLFSRRVTRIRTGQTTLSSPRLHPLKVIQKPSGRSILALMDLPLDPTALFWGMTPGPNSLPTFLVALSRRDASAFGVRDPISLPTRGSRAVVGASWTGTTSLWSWRRRLRWLRTLKLNPKRRAAFT
mmetsp:Transcript_10213/g.28699  ORF Transcript_10213/g.28699 Transcript_10213/m.28699 type:complete len:220 (+) Transcript_10213:483-1142(+)